MNPSPPDPKTVTGWLIRWRPPGFQIRVRHPDYLPGSAIYTWTRDMDGKQLSWMFSDVLIDQTRDARGPAAAMLRVMLRTFADHDRREDCQLQRDHTWAEHLKHCRES